MAKNQNFKNYVGDYFIGLDIGTNSVGWAVVDDKMNLLKFNGKLTWGSRLFDEAKSAQDRRTKRNMRRRLVRRRVRIQLLRELMEPMIDDKDFFVRLDDSFFLREDRKLKNKWNIFNDVDYNDSDFYAEYPTIYHLRNALIKNENQKFDPRLIYLAVHHIMKYRGNFLFPNLSMDGDDGLEEKFQEILDAFKEDGFEYKFEQTNKEVLEILLDNDKNATQKIKELTYEDNKEFLKLILGQKVDLNKVFDGHDFEDNKNLKLNDSAATENIGKIQSPDIQNRLMSCYELFNMLVFKKVMKDTNYISELMIKRYDKYKNDLVQLKRILKANMPVADFESYFRALTGKGNEHNYAHYTERGGACKYEDFKTELKKILLNIKANTTDLALQDEITQIDNELTEDIYLRKLKTSENTAFPMQVNIFELKKILNNQEKFYPYIAEIKDKIIKIFEFRIDYFVGPLSTKADGSFGWIERNPGYENVTINALNYKDAVDFEASQEKFIKRMTRDCTYILGEKALPKNSIYYVAFNLLNELNNIRFTDANGYKPLSASTREKVFAHLINYKNTISRKELAHYIGMETDGKFDPSCIKMSGVDKLNSNLKSIRDFVNILGDVNLSNIAMIEDIIEWITILGESKDTLERKIRRYYGHLLTDTQIKQIRSLNYAGWGRLSRKLIHGITIQLGGTNKTILELMQEPGKSGWYGNFNHFYSRYGFKDRVEKLNIDNTQQTISERIKDLAGSPAIKRGINQAYKIVDELVSIFKRPPARIFVEFARDEQEKGDKGRKSDRKQQIVDKYKGIDANYRYILNSMEEQAHDILKQKDNEKEFDRDKFFLYYLQAGRCAYTGEQLYLDELDQYHIDHIVPQSLIKDDSLDNRVLVTSYANEKKGWEDTVPDVFREKMKGTWAVWRACGLLTAEKYSRLTKPTLSDEDKKRFINRQLVETRQITLNTCAILQTYFEKKFGKGKDGNPVVEIKPVRAKLTSQFRDMFGYYKGLGGREINDFHHAKDAYIAVFLGEYLAQNFANLSENFDILHYQKKSTKQPRGYGFVLNTLLIDDEKWGSMDLYNDEAMANFDRNYYYTNILWTKKTIKDPEGAFYDETVYKSVKNQEKFFGKIQDNDLITLGKKGKTEFIDAEIYGGHKSRNPYSFALIKGIKNNKSQKPIIKFVMLPKYYLSGNDKVELDKFIADKFNIKDYTVLALMPKYQMYKMNGCRCFITGLRYSAQARQLVFGRENKELYEFIYHIYKNDNFKTLKIQESEDRETKIDEYVTRNYEKFKNIYLDHMDKCYYPDKVGFTQKIVENFDKYSDTRENKIFAIKELLKNTKCSSSMSKVIDLSLPNQFSIDAEGEDTYIIDQSITGLFEHCTKVLDLGKQV